MTHNALVNGHCVAFAQDDACLVEPHFLPGEPAGFAPDARALWALLQQVEGWHCMLADAALACVLGPLIEQDWGKSVRYYADVLFEMGQPITHSLSAVRVLTQADLPLLLATPALSTLTEMQHHALLTAGLQTGVVVDDQLVALANVDSPTGYFAEIGVVTAEAYRKCGYATAAASLIVQQLLSHSRIPLWSCGESNIASISTAHKLGFVERDRRLYVIPTKSDHR